jgi:hypothetical protein
VPKDPLVSRAATFAIGKTGELPSGWRALTFASGSALHGVSLKF